MTKDEALDKALEAFVRAERDGYWSRDTAIAVEAIKQARSEPTVQPVQEPLSELEKDAANLLFALHDAWPYVHGHCTIESTKKAIQALMVKHGDFADLHPPAAQPAPVQEPVDLAAAKLVFLPTDHPADKTPIEQQKAFVLGWNAALELLEKQGPLYTAPTAPMQEPVGEWVDGRSEAKRIAWKPGYVVNANVGDKIYATPPAPSNRTRGSNV